MVYESDGKWMARANREDGDDDVDGFLRNYEFSEVVFESDEAIGRFMDCADPRIAGTQEFIRTYEGIETSTILTADRIERVLPIGCTLSNRRTHWHGEKLDWMDSMLSQSIEYVHDVDSFSIERLIRPKAGGALRYAESQSLVNLWKLNAAVEAMAYRIATREDPPLLPGREFSGTLRELQESSSDVAGVLLVVPHDTALPALLEGPYYGFGLPDRDVSGTVYHVPFRRSSYHSTRNHTPMPVPFDILASNRT